MSTKVTIDQFLHLAPNIRSGYRETIEKGQAVLDQHHISDSPLRVAHFMTQILHESGGLSIQYENLNYSAERMPKVWPSRFKPKAPLNPADYAHNPQKIANEVYGGRMGNTGANDGYTYRGRGLMQLTGKESYRLATDIFRKETPTAPDLVANPEEVIGGNWSLAIAVAEWVSKGCNALADQDDIRKITRAINGGFIGFAEPMVWAKRTKAIWR